MHVLRHKIAEAGLGMDRGPDLVLSSGSRQRETGEPPKIHEKSFGGEDMRELRHKNRR